jgi:hypothetical protein
MSSQSFILQPISEKHVTTIGESQEKKLRFEKRKDFDEFIKLILNTELLDMFSNASPYFKPISDTFPAGHA